MHLSGCVKAKRCKRHLKMSKPWQLIFWKFSNVFFGTQVSQAPPPVSQSVREASALILDDFCEFSVLG